MIDLDPLLVAVRQAASLTRSVQQTQIVRSDKAGREPVTIADYGSQAIICRALSIAFPHDAILAEEQSSQFLDLVSVAQRQQVAELVADVLGEPVSEDAIVRWLDYGQNRQAERTWVIDPIDGTKGFLAQRRYSIAVGLLVAGQPIAGVMGSPGYPSADGLGLLFHAQAGKAYAQPMSGGEPRLIQVSTTDRILIVESVEAAHKDDSQMQRARHAARLDDAPIERMDGQDKYAAVACGDADLYLRLPKGKYQHKSWDHAAGVALVQAAGGVVTDIDGAPLNFASGRIMAGTKGMVVTNGRIHQRMLAGLRSAFDLDQS